MLIACNLTQTIVNGIPYSHENIKWKCTCILTIILTYNNYKQAMFLILGDLKDGSVKPKLVSQL